MKLPTLLIAAAALAAPALAISGSPPPIFRSVSLANEERTSSSAAHIARDEEAECRARFLTFEHCLNVECHGQKMACKEKCSKTYCSQGSTVDAPFCNLSRNICRKVPANGEPGAPINPPDTPPQTGKECWDRETACQKKPECHDPKTSYECYTKCHCEQCQYETCVKKGNYQNCFWFRSLARDNELHGLNVRQAGGRSYACRLYWGMKPPPKPPAKV